MARDGRDVNSWKSLGFGAVVTPVLFPESQIRIKVPAAHPQTTIAEKARSSRMHLQQLIY